VKILNCRRSIVALIGIAALVAIALLNKADVSGSIAMIVLAVAGSNAYQNKGKE
jgi:hypothetical protein